jgi:hypothetical protein
MVWRARPVFADVSAGSVFADKECEVLIAGEIGSAESQPVA